MRKYLLATLILLTVSVLAGEEKKGMIKKGVIKNSSDFNSVSKQPMCRNWFVNFNVGYFHPFSESLRTVIGEGGADYQLVLTYNWNCYFGCFISGALYRFGIQNQYLDCTTYSGSSSLYKNLGIRQQCFATLFSARIKMVFCWGKK